MQLKELKPADLDYERVLGGLFNGDAAATQPAAIVQPLNEEQVVAAVVRAREEGLRLRVCSGGHSRFCSGDGALMLDLAAHFRDVSVSGDVVTVQGGTGMGSVLQALAPHGRMLPVGTHPTPGFGLLTMGGLGHLSRRFGLTLDQIVTLRGVDGKGETFAIDQSDPTSAAWRYLRGAAPFLAVVTEVSLRTQPRTPLWVNRDFVALAELPQALTDAEQLPREISCSWVLGVAPDQKQPVAMRYWVMEQHTQEQHPEAWAFPKGGWQQRVAGLEELPAFNLPCQDGTLLEELPADPDRHRRLKSWIYALSVPPGQVTVLAAVLQKALLEAPNRLCRIDLQHSGGAVRDPLMKSSAYKGRQAEWSLVVSSFWPAGDTTAGEAARAWADGVFDALETIACHVYLVERHPGTQRYRHELALAYGPDLAELQELKKQWDPDGILQSLEQGP